MGSSSTAFVCCCSEAIINACLSACGRDFLMASGGRRCCKEQQSGIVFGVKWQQRSGAFMHGKQATVASFFLNQTLKLVMKVTTVSHVMITDMKEEKPKEFTLVFAVKQTHSSVTQRAVSYFIQSRLCSTATLLCFTVSELIQ